MTDTDQQFRPQNLSPGEEFQQRLKYVSPPEKLTDADVSMLLNHTRIAKVVGTKIVFTEGGVEHKFKHIDALSCQPSMNNKKVLVHWVRDFPNVVFVLTDKLVYVETVPREGMVKWFDSKAAANGLRDQQVQLQRLSAELTELHKGDTQKRLDANQRNIENAEQSVALQRVYTFPISAQRAASEATDQSPEIKDARIESQPEGGADSLTFPERGGSLTPVGDLAEAEDQPDQSGGRTPYARRRTISKPSDAITEEIRRVKQLQADQEKRQLGARRILSAVTASAPAGNKPRTASKQGMMAVLMARSRKMQESKQEVGE